MLLALLFPKKSYRCFEVDNFRSNKGDSVNLESFFKIYIRLIFVEIFKKMLENILFCFLMAIYRVAQLFSN